MQKKAFSEQHFLQLLDENEKFIDIITQLEKDKATLKEQLEKVQNSQLGNNEQNSNNSLGLSNIHDYVQTEIAKMKTQFQMLVDQKDQQIKKLMLEKEKEETSFRQASNSNHLINKIPALEKENTALKLQNRKLIIENNVFKTTILEQKLQNTFLKEQLKQLSSCPQQFSMQSNSNNGKKTGKRLLKGEVSLSGDNQTIKEIVNNYTEIVAEKDRLINELKKQLEEKQFVVNIELLDSQILQENISKININPADAFYTQ